MFKYAPEDDFNVIENLPMPVSPGNSSGSNRNDIATVESVDTLVANDQKGYEPKRIWS